ncbi:UTRA domain-containing protein [Oceanobacillus aidingensis]|uniref:UTRA domain-containing protein n=1 Tax=Oceanobacillus aidingensis TaxID=645964 RepID=A0ABV9JSI2_9BACI
MKLNGMSEKPLYLQLKEHLKSEINMGKYSQGERLPPESEICDVYGVSRITTRRAIMDLVDEGILLRKQGKGTFVQDTKHKRELISVGGFSELTSSSGNEPHTKIISSKLVDQEKCKYEFSISKDSNLLELHRLLYIDNTPFILETSYYPLELLPDLEKLISSTKSTYQILKEEYNIRIVSSYKTVNIGYATVEEGKLLNCDTGSILYNVEKISSDQNERYIHFSKSLFIADKVTFTLNIDRNE